MDTAGAIMLKIDGYALYLCITTNENIQPLHINTAKKLKLLIYKYIIFTNMKTVYHHINKIASVSQFSYREYTMHLTYSSSL